ncbi:Outer membrane protein assembly factor BamD [Dirofilaria immitis]
MISLERLSICLGKKGKEYENKIHQRKCAEKLEEEIKYGSCNAANDMDNYIQIYSNGEDLPYVYYLRVLSYYMQIHKVQLGQRAAYKTLDLATEYINFFPNSIYTEEVKGKETPHIKI